VTGGRYRAGPPGDTLSIVPTAADTTFDVLGPLNNLAGLSTSASATACVNGSAACVAVYNTGQAGTDAWNRDHTGGGWKPDNLATLAGISATSVSFDNTHFASGESAFPAHSPGQRFFIVDSPVSFLCDAGAGTLRRYEGYNITHPHTSADEHAELTGLSNPAEHALVADQVSTCSFTYTAGSPSRNALLTVAITVAEGGEDITLLQQVNVPNLP
jgi:MSHA biogenesis protein MshO